MDVRSFGQISTVLAAGCLLLLGCGPTLEGPRAPGGDAAPVEKEYGGVFQYATQAVPDGLYWFDEGTSGRRGRPMAANQIWDGLITYELVTPEIDYRASGKFVGSLAESWNQPDPKTFVFNLRRGVKWHDGTEFTSKDVLWSLARWGDQTSLARLRAMNRKFEQVEAPNPHQVRITLKQPDLEFIQDLAISETKILPAHVAEKAGSPAGDALRTLYERNVVGTGPFKLRAFDRQRHLEAERFDEYWARRPYLDGTRTVFGLDRSGMQAAFITRQVDYVSLDDRVQFETVKAAATDAQKMSYPTGHNWGLQFNLQRKPFDDVRVRRAVHLGIDRQKLLDAVTFGEGLIAGPAPVLPTLSRAGWGMPPEEYMKLPGWRQPKEQDLAEAKRLLAEAGYPNGFKTVMHYGRGNSHPTTQAEPVASQLKSIGLDVEVRVVEEGIYADQVYVRKDFEMINEGVTAGYNMVTAAYAKWHSRGTANYSQVNDPDLDRLIEAALAEADDKKRNPLFTQMQRIIVDKAYYAPIVTLAQFVAVQPWVHDFFPSWAVNPELLDASLLWVQVGTMPELRRKL